VEILIESVKVLIKSMMVLLLGMEILLLGVMFLNKIVIVLVLSNDVFECFRE